MARFVSRRTGHTFGLYRNRGAAAGVAAIGIATILGLMSVAPTVSAQTRSSRHTNAATRPSARILGKRSPIRLVRVVYASQLPPPKNTKPIPEPRETKPVRKAPRTKGIIAIQVGKIGAPAGMHGTTIMGSEPHALGPHFTLTTAFPGLADSGPIPPDTQVAASPTDVVEFNNRQGIVWNHVGGMLANFDLGALFSGIAGTGADPKIVYDAASGDFFASLISKYDYHNGPSQIDLAVTNNPVGAWFVYDVHNEGILQDQPKLGVSSDKITLAWNDNGNSGPEEIKTIQKAGVVAHLGSVPGAIWGPDPTRLNVVPAIQLSVSSIAFAVYHNYGTARVGILSINGVPGISPVFYTEAIRAIAGTSSPPAASQPPVGGSASPYVDTGDDRFESAVWQYGNLWAAGNDVCRYFTDNTARSCLRVVHITTASMTVVRDVDITLVGGFVMYPAVVLDARGDFWLSFSASSTSLYASALVAEAPGGVIGSSIGAILYGPGTGSMDYTHCFVPPQHRFGDYSGMAIDPGGQVGHGIGVWAAAEFGVPGCSYGTQIGQFLP